MLLFDRPDHRTEYQKKKSRFFFRHARIRDKFTTRLSHSVSRSLCAACTFRYIVCTFPGISEKKKLKRTDLLRDTTDDSTERRGLTRTTVLCFLLRSLLLLGSAAPLLLLAFCCNAAAADLMISDDDDLLLVHTNPHKHGHKNAHAHARNLVFGSSGKVCTDFSLPFACALM